MIGARASLLTQPILRQLTTGVRASRRRVGYLGSEAALTVLNVGDTLPGGWSAVWDTGSLVVHANNVTIDHYRINAGVVFTGDNPVMTNCVIHCQPGNIFGVTVSGDTHGALTISDTTVVGDGTTGTPQVNGISSDSALIARRCDVSNTGDGIHMVSQSDPTKAIISQCYVHDLAFIDEAQHCDGIQIFNNTTVASTFTVEHCYIARTLSTIGTPLNSAMTCGTAVADSTPLATPIINNNYFDSGLYHLRVNFRVHNSTVTNNDFGPLYVNEFGVLAMETPVTTWSGNRDSASATISNPAPISAPTIKEVLQTSDNRTTQQILTTSAGTTAAGDMLVIVYLTDNSAAPLPTSSAGTLTQHGTDAINGNGDGCLRVFTAPVGSAGSQTVTIPAAGGFDVFGVVMVMQGQVEAEGFVKTNYTSSVTSFTTPSTTLVGVKDMLVTILFSLEGRTFDLSATPLTQQANPKALPFSSLNVSTSLMTAAGATPIYNINTVGGPGKPAMVSIGLQRLSL